MAPNQEVLPLRTRYREEMNCQIVHDSIHRREGWTVSYLLDIGDVAWWSRFGGEVLAPSLSRN